MVKVLIDAGADVNASGNSGTPLHKAVWFRSNDFTLIRLLITKGADVNNGVFGEITPLHMAAHWGNSDCAKLLIQHGANVDAKTSRGYQPIHVAAAVGVARYLFGFESYWGSERERYGDHEKTARLLVEHGADVKSATVDGIAPVHVTSFSTALRFRWRRKEVFTAELGRMAKTLVSLGADVNVKENNGHTPWSLATFFENAELAAMLVRLGAVPLPEMPSKKPVFLKDDMIKRYRSEPKVLID